MIETITTGSYATNSYIISNDKKECIIVDPGLNYKEASLYIKSKYTPKAVFLTHCHFDHIDGIEYFMYLPIYIHKLDEEGLYDNVLSLYYMMNRCAPFSKGDLDIRTVEDDDIISIIGYEFKVYHTPGHTNGSCVFFFDNNLLSGDTLFRGSCGRVDFPSGNASKMEKSLKKIIATFDDNVKCYPGHEGETTIGFERKNNPFINN